MTDTTTQPSTTTPTTPSHLAHNDDTDATSNAVALVREAVAAAAATGPPTAPPAPSTSTDTTAATSLDPLPPLDDLEAKEQDRFLPNANVARIMKRTLPDTAKISKEAKECVMECVSEFIAFVTSEASDRCQQEKRKTINGEDILWAMQNLGFDNYAEAMKVYLQKYREQQQQKNGRGKSQDAGDQGAESEPTPSGLEHAAYFEQHVPEYHSKRIDGYP
ncbi:hypothetical protein AMAG_08343 [Allomyces macrogynus ATCC 38327]|uniref:Transcription factor CBF/NF-Y/archaeal histone domain-containing protein n=1 Tax=Allomyces macrogynus (strain ATCC 38327) TaxID=578462 RepID=A0A0L0SLC9_ALLM3|nr:hypothetical protein AMAG_08343 [Allomyces macrogynus ATCC 38327]|eukprot:KNE63190.1 hypothetical protein AMAG_08343 [Allomyces macrogynus ATCC 38327]